MSRQLSVICKLYNVLSCSFIRFYIVKYKGEKSIVDTCIYQNKENVFIALVKLL